MTNTATPHMLLLCMLLLLLETIELTVLNNKPNG